MKLPLIVRESNFFSCGLYTLAFARQPQTCKCLKLGFLSVHNSKGLLGPASVGTSLTKTTVFNACMMYPQKFVYRKITHDTSNHIQQCSITPFCHNLLWN